MADYFTNVSLVVVLPSPEAVQYAVDLAKAMSDLCNEDGPKADIIPEGWTEDIDEQNWCFDVVAVKDGTSAIWIMSDNGGIDEIIQFGQHLLVKFAIEDPVEMEWSHDCSKPRDDAYGGGAAFITQTSAETWNTSQWLSEQRMKHEEESK